MMKVFTKLGLALLMVTLTSGMLWAQTSNAGLNVDKKTQARLAAQNQVADVTPQAIKPSNVSTSEDAWDLQFSLDLETVTGALGNAGAECDGNYYYSTRWATNLIHKYDLTGNLIEEFSISGVSGLRDLAYDGTYMYGGAAATTIFEMDFDSQSLISTISSPQQVRSIAYDVANDALWCANWDTDLTLVSKAGAAINSIPAAVHGLGGMYGTAYDDWTPGGPYLWIFDQGAGAGTAQMIYQADLNTLTMTGFSYDVMNDLGPNAQAIAGGLFTVPDIYTGTVSIGGLLQGTPDMLFTYELYQTGPLPDNDLGIQSITEPTSGVNLSGAENVTVTVKNYGTEPQSGFDIWFTLDGGSPVVETISSTVNGGETYSHTFATTVDLSAYGTYEFEACTDLSGDENADNDCATKSVTNSEPSNSLCQPTYSTGCAEGDGFTDFAVEEIQNYGSGCANNTGFLGWSEYYDLGPATLMPGETYTFTMSTGFDSQYVNIWIDFNDDMVLSADEMILQDFFMETAGVSYDVDIPIPSDAPMGEHAMRAMDVYFNTFTDPCGSYSYGEAEDYTVMVGEGNNLEPPTNLVAEVVGPDENDVDLIWNAPAGGSSGNGEWIEWDDGTNDDGIGLTSGGTFYAASRWTPSDLGPYDGQNITKMSFFAYGDPDATYTLMAWTGANAGTQIMTQAITSFTVDAWNEVTLTSPITVNASDELWFGCMVVHGAGTFPMGVDPGPAVAEYGDMFSVDASTWISISIEYSLDVNWNMAAYVEASDVTYEPVKMVKTVNSASTGTPVISGTGNNNIKFQPSASKALLGYNVYRDGEMIEYVTDTTTMDENLSPGTYDYYVTAVYDEGESGPSNTETVTIPNNNPLNEVFCDDYEAYNVGEQLVMQNGTDWTTWSNAPGSAEDPYISDQDGNTVEITGTNDLVHVMPNYTEGYYEITFNMYIPTGADGYFNTLQDFNGTSSMWGMQVYFGETNPGEGNLDANGALVQMFTFDYDTWMSVKVTVDLDNDWGQFYLDDALIHEWVWSEGAFGGNALNQLGGNNFFAWPDGANGNPDCFFDNYCVWTDQMVLAEPLNLTGPTEVVVNEDINLTWDAPGGGDVEELIYDNGVNTGAYSYEGYTMSTHMSPAGPCKVLTMKFYTTTQAGDNDFNATMFEWAGSQPATDIVYEENVMAVADDWMEVDISSQNITFDGDFVVGFGSINGTTFLGYDADLNNGRSWDFNNTSPSWASWTEAYLIRAIVEYTDGTKAEIGAGIPTAPQVMNPVTITSAHPTDYSGVETVKPIDNIVSGVKALTGYNVYRNGTVIGDTPSDVTEYTDNVDTPGQYTYNVTAVYDEGESGFSNNWVVDVLVGIEDNVQSTTMIYPNPANDVVNIKSDYTINTITIYNYSGQIVANEQVDNTVYSVNTSDFRSGIYFFQIDTENGRISHRIVIE